MTKCLYLSFAMLIAVSTACSGCGEKQQEDDVITDDAAADQPEAEAPQDLDEADVPGDPPAEETSSDLPDEDSIDVAPDDAEEDGMEEAFCGNGLQEAGEQCDDGNGVDGDGCDGDCTYSCIAPADCDDASFCNGLETCDFETHVCLAGVDREDGDVCNPDPRSICLGAACVESECGDGFVDTGGGEFCDPPLAGTCTDECNKTCGSDVDCSDDGNVCNGSELCDTGLGLCSRTSVSGTAGLVCRAPAGPCDQQELCDGVSPDCPFDDFKPDTFVCRLPDGVCDVAEFCTGLSALCPEDAGFIMGGVSSISAGHYHTCALMDTGAAKCWGQNRSGQLGDGTIENRNSAVDVSGLSSGVAALAAGLGHTCALMDSGDVKCWGENRGGQLGDGTTWSSHTPVDVVGLSSGVSALAAGNMHTCALLDTGGIQCWGDNGYGQLGDGTTTMQTTPVDVRDLTSGVLTITAGDIHTCALLNTGEVRCWGSNAFSQLGDGTTTNRTTPVEVTGLAAAASAITAGYEHTCALLDTGGVQCWGGNRYGQIGDGTTTMATMPVHVSGLTSGVSAVTAGINHTCALMDTEGVKCWGYNEYGQLGDGATTDRTLPMDVTGLASGVSAITAGMHHTCSLMDDGQVKCWGSNEFGQRGDGIWTGVPVPLNMASLTSGVSLIATGCFHTCVLLDTGGALCWGNNEYGQLGDGTTAHSAVPVDVSGLTSGVSSLSAGSLNTCALLAAGGVRCWGLNAYGQLGDGTTTDSAVPVDVSGLSSGVSAIETGLHTCTLMDSGGVMCWGYNEYGQLGDGSTTNSTVPVEVSGLSSGVSAISAGSLHTCSLTDTGGAMCWGNNGSGRLGDGTTTDRTTPVDVSGLSSGVSAIALGVCGGHTCAILDTGGVKCWGLNRYGQLGDGSFSSHYSPVDVLGLSSGVSAISAGSAHTCALLDTGGVKCWGDNVVGQVGDGTFTGRSSPVDVAGLSSGVSAVAAGGLHTCALLDTGGVMCWGSDDHGLGSGIFREYPHEVCM